MHKFSKILPSKQFVLLIGSAAVIVLLVLIGTSHFGSESSFNMNITKNAAISANGTIGEVIARDSNDNGIADWEESLWGLDPKGDGAANKKIIDDKKAAAGVTTSSSGSASDAAPATPTSQFARDLLTTILALKQAGSLTPEAITNIGNSIGQNIDQRRSTTPAYTMQDIHLTSGDITKDKLTYRLAVKNLLIKYQKSGIGSEFDLLSNALSDPNNKTDLAGLTHPAQAYINLGKDIVALPTPKDAAFYALAFANASDGTGHGLLKAESFYTDVITGMVGIDEYVHYNDSFALASDRYAEYFTQF